MSRKVFSQKLKLCALFPSTGVLRESHRHLDGCLSAVCVLSPARVRSRELHRPPTQGAAALPTEATTHEGNVTVTFTFAKSKQPFLLLRQSFKKAMLLKSN